MSRRHGPLEASLPYESGVWGTPENPCPSERTLAARLDGELDGARARAVDTHLDGCLACASDAERLENLSGCLQSWNRSRGMVEPSPRLLTRVLRDVSLESGALRQETRAARRRFALAAAAAGLVLAASGWLGAQPFDEPADRSASAASEAALVVALAEPHAPFQPSLPRIDAVMSRIATRASLADSTDVTLKAPESERRRPLPPIPRDVLAEPSAIAAFAQWVPAVDARRRSGEDVCVLDGRAVAVWARLEYEHVRQWDRWIAERARIVLEPGTRDPSAAGVALADVLPLPSDASGTGAPATRDAIYVPATSQSGGLVLWALPHDVSTASSRSAYRTTDTATSKPPTDLATAVRAGRAKLLPDYAMDRSDVGLEVLASDTPILVPAGEFLAGGAGDRVVAQGVWLPASKSAYLIRLATRPVSRFAGRVGVAPTVVNRVAGPQLRALLARGEDASAVLELVHSQLRDAGLLPPEGEAEPSLLALYADDAHGAIRWNGVAGAQGPTNANVWDDTRVHAERLVSDLGSGVAGFVAADPNGRFQGLERVELTGEAGRAVLVRLIAGYLAEARARSAADAARTGVQATDVLGALSRRPPRLAPADAVGARLPAVDVRTVPALKGLEPHTGVLLQGVRSSEKQVPLISGLVRDFMR